MWNAKSKEWKLYIETDSVVEIISSNQFKTCVSELLIERRSDLGLVSLFVEYKPKWLLATRFVA